MKEVGGGRVSGFQDKNTVLVEDSDGFEIPMPISEVVVERGESYENGTWAKRKEEQKAKTPNTANRNSNDVTPLEKAAEDKPEYHTKPLERREGEKLNVFLAFIPNTPDDMVGTTFDAYIINDSNYFITLTWLSAQGTAWRARFGGTIEPNTKEFLEEISREQLDDISRIAVQMIAYKREKTFALKPAISVEMRIDGTKFYKTGAFKQSMFFEEPALVLDVVKDDIPVRTMFADAGQIREALMGKKEDTAPKHHTAQPARIKKAKEKNVLYIHFTMDDNPSLSESVKKRYKSLYSGAFYERFIEGKWVTAQGLVYPMFSPERHIKRCDGGFSRYYLSCDYGTVNPASFGLWGRQNGVWYRTDEFYFDSRREGRQMTDAEYAGKLRQLAGGRTIREVIVDPSAASFIEVLRREGWKVRKADNDVLSGIRRTADALRAGRIVICDRCTDCLREMELYVWDLAAGGDRVVKKNDHAMDDMRYFVTGVLGSGTAFAVWAPERKI